MLCSSAIWTSRRSTVSNGDAIGHGGVSKLHKIMHCSTSAAHSVRFQSPSGVQVDGHACTACLKLELHERADGTCSKAPCIAQWYSGGAHGRLRAQSSMSTSDLSTTACASTLAAVAVLPGPAPASLASMLRYSACVAPDARCCTQ